MIALTIIASAATACLAVLVITLLLGRFLSEENKYKLIAITMRLEGYTEMEIELELGPMPKPRATDT